MAKNLKNEIKKQIEALTGKLTIARASATLYSTQVADMQRELTQLEGALAALEGRTPDIKIPEELRKVMLDTAATRFAGIVPDAKETFTTNPTLDPNSKLVEVNGIQMILEPGMEIGKNAHGEDCIVPIGTKMPEALEPVKPAPVNETSFAPPALTSGEGFDDPQDMFMEEINSRTKRG